MPISPWITPRSMNAQVVQKVCSFQLGKKNIFFRRQATPPLPIRQSDRNSPQKQVINDEGILQNKRNENEKKINIRVSYFSYFIEDFPSSDVT